MNIALWIGQIQLAIVFTGSGSLKISQPKQKLIDTGQTGVAFFPLWAIRVIAASELLGVIGILVPWATGIARFLTPLAAACFAALMVGAAISHAKLREPRNVATNAVLFTISVLVAWGRFADLASGV